MSQYVTMALICAALGLWGCGDSDSNNSTGPEPTQETTVDATAVMPILATLEQTFAGLDIVQLFSGNQVMEGQQGTLTLTASEWTFDQYSTDGQVIINGDLGVGLLASPVTIAGDLLISGTQDGDLQVDVTVDPQAEEPQLNGTLTYNGFAFDIAELMALGASEE